MVLGASPSTVREFRTWVSDLFTVNTIYNGQFIQCLGGFEYSPHSLLIARRNLVILTIRVRKSYGRLL